MLDPCPPSGAVPCQSPRRPVEDPKAALFKPHPRKPRTSEGVQDFVALVRSNGLTMSEIGARYGTCKRTAHRWAREFGVGHVRRRRPDFRGPIKTDARAITAATLRAVTEIGRSAGHPGPEGCAGLGDPKADPEIAGVLAHIRSAALDARRTPDVAELQRLVLKLLCLLLAKAPHTFMSLSAAAAEIFKLVLCARRVEADLPPSHDPVRLRQEAARQLLQELGSVLSAEEQALVNGLLREGARRLRARQERKPEVK